MPLGDSAIDRAPRTPPAYTAIENPGGSLIDCSGSVAGSAARAEQASVGRRRRERDSADFKFWILDFGLKTPMGRHSLLRPASRKNRAPLLRLPIQNPKSEIVSAQQQPHP